MNLSEMTHSIHLATRIPKTKVSAVLKELFQQVQSTTMSGEHVTLSGFGRFDWKTLKPRLTFGKMTKGKGVLKFSQRRKHGQVRSGD